LIFEASSANGLEKLLSEVEEEKALNAKTFPKFWTLEKLVEPREGLKKQHRQKPGSSRSFFCQLVKVILDWIES